MKVSNRKVEKLSIAGLKPWPRHARKHDAGKLETLTRAIRQDGLIDPIIVDECDTVLSGHLRVAACRSLGQLDIDCIRVTHLSDAQKASYVIAANRFPERGGWDLEVLKIEFDLIVDLECNVEITTTGFDVGDVDVILGRPPEVADEPPLPDLPTDPVCQPDDLWALGDHLLYCGDGLVGSSWNKVMAGQKAQLCITDPPYNVKVKGHVSSGHHENFAMGCGEFTPSEFIQFLNAALGFAVEHSSNGALHFVFMDHGHLRELYAACDTLYDQQLNLIVWSKTNAGMGSFYRSRHELVGLFKVGNGAHTNNVRLGKYGRNRSNVWTYPGTNTFRKGRDKDLADHPTVKPVAMLADAILDASNPGDVVIDGFGGSGSLILAAEKTGRQARVIEIDPRYCDVAIRRWEEATGKTARLCSQASTHQYIASPDQVLLLPSPAQGEAS